MVPSIRPARPSLFFTVLFAGLAPLALGAGCDWPNDSKKSDYRDRLATVSQVSAPESAAVGTSFDVTITSWGPNGCWRKGGDSVARPNALLAVVTPYDREPTGEVVCTQNIVSFKHVVSIQATDPGKLDVQVRTRLRTSAGKDSTGQIDAYVQVY